MLKVKMKGKSVSLNPMEEEHMAFQSKESVTEIWHKRLGHFHYRGLLQMERLNIVKDIPNLQEHSKNC